MRLFASQKGSKGLVGEDQTTGRLGSHVAAAAAGEREIGVSEGWERRFSHMQTTATGVRLMPGTVPSGF